MVAVVAAADTLHRRREIAAVVAAAATERESTLAVQARKGTTEVQALGGMVAAVAEPVQRGRTRYLEYEVEMAGPVKQVPSVVRSSPTLAAVVRLDGTAMEAGATAAETVHSPLEVPARTALEVAAAVEITAARAALVS
jgi:hypothetical protein